MATVTSTDIEGFWQSDEEYTGNITDSGGSAIDLTNPSAELEFIAQREYDDGNILLNLDMNGADSSITGEADGDYTIPVDGADWDSLSIGRFVYTLWLTDPVTGKRKVVKYGNWDIYGTATE